MTALISGCGLMNPGGVSNPITPEQSKAQVVDSAREIVHTLDLHVLSAAFRHAPCNDDGVAPYRGEVIVAYPLAASMDESDAEIAKMVERLRGIGWTGDPDFHSHSSALKKNNVVAQFDPQTVSDKKRGITLLGECRDVTTSTKYGTEFEDISLD
ncbi:hypothetical protein FZI95_14100 [Mycobacterium sp. CBMA247]|nr:hypothetical protein [Mycolicibacterium sp. CBMA 329]MUL89442.1 hypothetical protein [Mycolicibacterium sp. CBMA 331]MUL99131.1 hypothetical protein [Mycolicibacterium sp. CBMA 334]MUM24757.1 hypothetical protein [Mycolicibacterium sp. CBMA 295]MUM38958.1 hypothetical protein [Mycolicibacterium sp. CBMA 247]MUM45506.1 hypothetical protein [Mycolicibacterium sp. CBMA 294]